MYGAADPTAARDERADETGGDRRRSGAVMAMLVTLPTALVLVARVGGSVLSSPATLATTTENAVVESSSSAAGGELELAASNAGVHSSSLAFTLRTAGYEQLPAHTLEMYGSRWDHIVEPHHATVLSVDPAIANSDATYSWRVQKQSKSDDSVETLLETTGHDAHFVFTEVNTMYSVRLVESVSGTARRGLQGGNAPKGDDDFMEGWRNTTADDFFSASETEEADTAQSAAELNALAGKKASSGNGRFGGGGAPERSRVVEKTRVICKYVRREIRELTEAHRERYLNALETIYTTTDTAGKARYGESFRSAHYFGALHNSVDYCFHGNLAFLTAHPAFALELDRSLQSIDAGLTQPYWDFMKDHSLGLDWSNSPVYNETWFGTVDNDGSDNFRIRGRFRNATAIYDPNHEYPSAFHNQYGFVDGEYNPAKSTYLQRTNSFCNFRTAQPFASCGHLKNCYSNFSSLDGFDKCLEFDVHANLHAMHGGLWDCSEDVSMWLEEIGPSVSTDLMSFVVLTLPTLLADRDTNFPWLFCPTSCAYNATACRCTSSIGNLDKMSDTEVYKNLYNALQYMQSGAYMGERYIEELSDGTLAFKAPAGSLTTDDDANLKRVLLKIVADPGTTSPMGGGAAPLDPIFWPMHGMFEKAWQVLRLSPQFTMFNLTWNNEGASPSCKGVQWHEETAFPRGLFGEVSGPGGSMGGSYYTNKELWEKFDPYGDDIPYVYANFTEWGECDWDPLAPLEPTESDVPPLVNESDVSDVPPLAPLDDTISW